MKLIPRYQRGTPKKGVLYESYLSYIPLLTTTFVPNGIYSITGQPYEVWKRETDLEAARKAYDKNELIGPVQNIPEDLKEYYKRRGETLLWMDQRARNFESFRNLLNLTMPSTYVGQIIGKQLTGPEALAVDLGTAPVLNGIKTVGKKGVQTAAKLATRGAEVYRRRFVYPREGLPQWFYTQKPLIAEGYNPVGKPIEYTVLKIRSGEFTKADAGNFLEKKGQVDDLFKNINKFGNNVSEPRILRTLLNKMKDGIKGKKGTNTAINRVIRDERTPAQIVRDLLNEYIPKLEEINNRTRLLTKELYGKQTNKNNFIDWLHDESPGVDFLGSGVYDPRYGRVVNKTPFLQRYYENVMEITKSGGLLDRLIRSGKLKLDLNGRWKGLNEESGKYELVDAKQYVISLLENFKKSGNRYTSMYQRPVHGTKLNSGSISKLFADPNKDHLFTVDAKNQLNGEILNAENIMLDVYAGKTGSRIPFYYKARDYEGKTLRAYPKKGESSESNHFGKYGELKTYFKDRTDKAHSVELVVDPTNHGGAINEYDFGKGTPNIKSMWNTLDFEIGGSPFAYIPTKRVNITSNNYA